METKLRLPFGSGQLPENSGCQPAASGYHPDRAGFEPDTDGSFPDRSGWPPDASGLKPEDSGSHPARAFSRENPDFPQIFRLSPCYPPQPPCGHLLPHGGEGWDEGAFNLVTTRVAPENKKSKGGDNYGQRSNRARGG